MFLDKKNKILSENEVLLDLWQQTKTGDRTAFCVLADKLYRTLYNYGTCFTSDREYLKDAIQELLIHIWEKRQSIHIQFVTIYFIKSLRNQLLQQYRRKKDPFLNIDDVDEITDNQTIETDIEAGETFSANERMVKSAINQLPKRQQEAIFLKFYKGLDNEQIADLMLVNKQSVANLLFKAISTLKTQINYIGHWLILIFSATML